MTPAEVQAFEAKKAKAQAAAASNELPVFVFTPTEWNTETFSKGKDLVVLETKPGIASDTWIKIVLDDKLSTAGRAATGTEQSYTVQLEPTFFVTEIDCQESCDPDWRNAVTFRSAFVSFGSGHGVWETSGGSILPFHARNFKSVKQWLAPLKVDELMPTIQKLSEGSFTLAPPNAKPVPRTLKVATDKIMAIGLDLAPAIGSDNMGLAWAAIQPGDPIDHTRHEDANITATLVQATNLGN